MRQAGVVITSTEMVIYELLRRAGTDEFRAVLPLVKCPTIARLLGRRRSVSCWCCG